MIRELFQLSQTLLQQRFRSHAVSLREVVERRCDLRDALQESLVRLLRLQPDGFPTFMRVKKLLRVELFYSSPEQCDASLASA
ncbi:MAG: hypothetical protein M1453_10105 [Acidobacteria bacterium]|nr:hypothetical protein [Acidobacteriota bacterium]